MSPKQKMAIAAVLILLLLAGALTVIWYYFKIDEVSVSGNKHYTVSQIEEMVLTGPLEHNSLYLSLKYRNKTIEGIPFIETMDVNVLSPTSISITVYEKSIAGCVGYLDRFMYFDKDGTVVESSTVRQTDIPYVAGLKFDHVIMYEKIPVEDEKIFDDILTITRLLTKYSIRTDQIHINSDKEVTLYFGKAKVLMGTMDNIDEKMINLKGLAEQMEGLSGTLDLENYSLDSEKKYVTFQRDDVEQHHEIVEGETGENGENSTETGGDGTENAENTGQNGGETVENTENAPSE
ncbi:MAG: FtsQ-type POTRA domain-containing protein [Lachnospiraceae bacterium]|nr:FtsQ-type POTRA domain-containing protein [Lachnospiraceae bacterium]